MASGRRKARVTPPNRTWWSLQYGVATTAETALPRHEWRSPERADECHALRPASRGPSGSARPLQEQFATPATLPDPRDVPSLQLRSEERPAEGDVPVGSHSFDDSRVGDPNHTLYLTGGFRLGRTWCHLWLACIA